MDEKRLFSFMWVAVCVVIMFTMVQRAIVGPPAARPAGAAKVAGEGQRGREVPDEPQDVPRPDALANDAREPVADGNAAAEAPDELPVQRYTLGSLDRDSGFEMLVTLNNRGASIERIELNSPRYRAIDPQSGYLGHMALTDDPEGGCRVQVVGPGTPAARATAPDMPQPGLRGPEFAEDAEGKLRLHTPGDLIDSIQSFPVRNRADLERILSRTRPGQSVMLGVRRFAADGTSRGLVFTAVLAHTPLQLVRPEGTDEGRLEEDAEGSLLLSIGELGDKRAPLTSDGIAGVPSLRRMVWKATPLAAVSDLLGPGIEFRSQWNASDLASVDAEGTWEFVKRFRLSRRDPKATQVTDPSAFQLIVEIELHNQGPNPQSIAYLLDGADGITDEGWWYSYKIHPRSFGAAGARDVVFKAVQGRHEMFLCGEITRFAQDNPQSPDKPMISADQVPVQLGYVGSDAQYFSTALFPAARLDSDDSFFHEDGCRFQNVLAHMIGTPDPKQPRRSNVTFRLLRENQEIAPGDALRDRFVFFAGPKDPKVLAHFGLDDFIVYGWFKVFAKPMVGLLHGLYWMSGKLSFGLAIVLLTVLVRGAMFPFGRQMALNAQKMQELAPEIKRIAEKYKDDMAKRSQAQQDLFRKHKYNPFSGCLVMFLQLPIFVGLYRALSVDIRLRQAPLIPGLTWCSNLAGPDRFWHWEKYLPPFLSAPSGWLGPYLNILPILSIVLMIIHQKLFTPPPQDEQQRSQQQVMKFMMIFMGFMFHKVAAGLCIYFIASSLWGLAERKLLPKSRLAAQPAPVTTGVKAPGGINGARPYESAKKARRRGSR